MKLDVELIIKDPTTRHRLKFTGFGNGLVINPSKGEEVDFSFSAQSVPTHRVHDAGHETSAWFAFWEADCAWPPICIIRATSFEDAYELFIDEHVEPTTEDLPEDMDDYDGNYNSNGEPVNTEAVQGTEIILSEITLLDAESVKALVEKEAELAERIAEGK